MSYHKLIYKLTKLLVDKCLLLPLPQLLQNDFKSKVAKITLGLKKAELQYGGADF